MGVYLNPGFGKFEMAVRSEIYVDCALLGRRQKQPYNLQWMNISGMIS